MEPIRETIESVNIEDEMQKSYIDYAMSVIIGRALPDVRDGLKPVHRRILFAMNELSNYWNKPYKKSARVVGDVIGKYHPHGDTAVYDTIVRMAQGFSLRYPLVDGQGNFGSIDGDSPAAMRYTEIKMERISAEMLNDIEKETVEFGPNYDDSLKEPLLLPAKIPNLLINGSSGIAVGMATNIPPHNLNEIITGIIALIDNPEITIKGLMKFVKGPDFPTAGFIYGKEGIKSAYETGRGRIQMRAKAIIEKNPKNDRDSIIVNELPYQVNKAKLVGKIAELVRDKKIEGISDLRDESDRDGIRVVIELKKEAITQVILNKLYKHTQMQETFGVIMLALDRYQPKVMDLKTLLGKFVQFRIEIVTRRTEFDLKKAKEKAHILRGLKIALNSLDEVIKLIKKAATPKEAQEKMIAKFKLDEIQAKAILDMKLQRLTGLERQKILDELKELEDRIQWLTFVLGSEQEIFKIIKDELREIQDKYGDERRSEIIEVTQDISIEDMIVEEDMVVTISNTGYIKRNPVSLYRAQRRGGRGIKGMSVKEEDYIKDLYIATTHEYLLFFSDIGRVYWLKVHAIPQFGRASKGTSIVNLLQLQKEEKIAAVVPVKEFEEDRFLVMSTRNGIVKKTPLMAFSNPRSTGIIALTIDKGDQLIGVKHSDGKRKIFLGTENGMAILFDEKQIRPIGRSGRGVRGITLKKEDRVVSMEVIGDKATALTITENGFGKRTESSEYRVQSRGGIGVINIKCTARNGKVMSIKIVSGEDQLMVITSDGNIIRMKVSEISTIGRNTQGYRIVSLKENTKIVDMARVVEKEE
ncbi:MAG TPA: DNA gyrase subunit A [Nitrospinota bacterium]|jgi:DNA gyrase subunit A|nr:DNA gyrase subunit A [Nitrospinota bacterium]